MKNKDYYKFNFLKYKVLGNGDYDLSSVTEYETNSHWNIVCKSMPFDLIGEAKDLLTINSPSIDGVKVFTPKEGGIPLKHQEVDIEFVCCSDDARRDMLRFRNFLIGADEKGALMGFKEEYTGINANFIIYKSFKQEIYHRREGINDIVIFTVSFLLPKPINKV